MKRNNVKQITVRLTADEYAHVKQLSKDSGLKMEPAIRRLIMGVNLRPRPPDELPELLRQLFASENPYNCPHGRPTVISVSRYDLEKRFKRS